MQSTPPVRLAISSITGQSGTTNYTIPGMEYGTSVILQAPATDPAGYTFSQWTVNGAAQADGQKSVTFTMDGAVTAVAQYTSNIGYALSVQSTPPVKQVISSSTGHGGTASYTKSGVAYGTSVNLASAGGGPGRIHLLAMDGERRSAACRAEVRHVHDGRSRDRRGGV